MPGITDITPEQRAAALAKATAARVAQSEIKKSLRAGEVSFTDLLQRGKTDQIVGKIKVLQLLTQLRGVGPAKARIIMEDCGIAENRRVGGLTPRQVASLEGTLGL